MNGGAITNDGRLNIINSTFYGNTLSGTSGKGGAVFSGMTGNQCYINNSILVGNTAVNGADFFSQNNNTGDIIIVSSVFTSENSISSTAEIIRPTYNTAQEVFGTDPVLEDNSSINRTNTLCPLGILPDGDYIYLGFDTNSHIVSASYSDSYDASGTDYTSIFTITNRTISSSAHLTADQRNVSYDVVPVELVTAKGSAGARDLKTMTVSATGGSYNCDGTAHGITVNVTDPATDYTIYYGEEEGVYTETDLPTYTINGAFTTYFMISASGYKNYEGSATVTIGKTPSLIVNSNSDDINFTTPGNTTTYLREALIYAERLAQGIYTSAQFASTSPDNIQVEDGITSITISFNLSSDQASDYTILLADGTNRGMLDIAADLFGTTTNCTLSIDGDISSSYKVILDGQHSGISTGIQIISIRAGNNVSISNMELQNGYGNTSGGIYNVGNLTLSNVIIANNAVASGGGGGICNVGNLTMQNVTFKQNLSEQPNDNGGAFYNSGNAYVWKCTFVQNSIVANGGAIYNTETGILSVENSLFDRKSASGNGGAIYNNGGALTIVNSTFFNNSATNGNGIYQASGATAIVNSTFYHASNSSSSFDMIGGTALLINTILVSGNAHDFKITGGTAEAYSSVITTNGISGTIALITLDELCQYKLAADVLGTSIALSADGTLIPLGSFNVSGCYVYLGRTTEQLLASVAIASVRNTDNIIEKYNNADLTVSSSSWLSSDQREVSYTDAATVGAFNLGDITATFTYYNARYDGNSHVGATVSDIIPDSGTTIWYSEDGSSYGTSSFSYAGPGSYTNYVKITALGYNDLIDQGTVLITEIPSLIVTTTDDIVLAYDGLYSLREVLGYAIQLAKGTLAETDFDTESQNSNIVTETGFTNVIISFNIDSTNLTITLDSDNGVMNVANETFIEAGYRLTLSGTNINTTSQNNITVDGGDTYRVTETTHTGTNMFWLGSGNYITISNMIFQNAYSLNSNKPGSVFYNSGNLTLSSCTISNNTLASGNGGAIYSSGTINITNCTISNNTILDTDARNSCGGSLFNTGKATISNTTFSDNNALNGGAIYIRNSASTNIENSTFSTNVAIYGGAIYNQYSSLGIKNSTFNQNGTEATTTQGGALYLYSGTTQVINSTFVANVATEKGGAVYNSGKLIILNSTFYNNGKSEQTLGGAIYSTSTSESVVANSIVIGNNGGSQYSDIYVYGIFKLYSCAVAGTSPNYSEIVIGNGSTFSDANNYFTTLEDIFGTDTPVLGDNGGQTQTLALSPDFKGLGGYLYLGYQSYYTWKIDVVRYSLSTYSATGEGYTQLYYNAAGSTFSHLLSDQRNVSYGALEGTPFLGSIGAYTLLTFAASASGVDCIYDGNAHSITVDVTVPETTGYTIKYGETSGIYNLDNSPEYTTVANPRVVYYKITEDGYRNYYGNASVKIKEVHSGIITDGSDEVNPYDNIISFREAILYKMGSFDFTQLTADAEGNYRITISNEEGLGTINIDYDVTINGTVTAEKNIIFDGASAVQLFTIAAGKEVTFTKMTIQNGNSGEYDGGAISNLGTLHLDNCVITNNQSTKNGGAIANLANAVLDINTNMTFSYNSAKNGGAIYNYTGTVTIDGADSASHFTFSNNTATYAGGAVINRSGTINISNIYFDNNTSHYNATVKNQYGHGGAVYNTDIMTITSSTFQNNKAKYANGGAIANGVGVNAATSKLTLTDVTIQNNEANYGGGIINAGNLELQGVLIQNNTAYYNGGGISNTDNEDSENEHGSIDVIGIGTTITSNQITANTATTGYGGGIISVSNTSLYLTGANLSITGNFAPNRTTGKDVSTYNVKNWPADTGTYVVTTSSALPNVVAKTSGTQTEVFYLYANDVFDYSSMSRMIKTIDEEKILSLQEDCTAKLTNLVNPLMYNYTFDVDGTKVIYRTTSLISSSDLGLTSGTYRGTLELTDLEGNSEGWGITDITLEVEAVNPTFKVQANDYLNGQILKLDINAQIASNSIQNWILNWGDGTEPTVYNREANSLAATHYYSTPGEYSLTLKVVDSLDLYCDSVWYLGTHTVFASENAPVLIPAAGNGQEVVLPSVVSRAAGDSNSPFEKEYWLALPEVYNESNFKTIVIPSHSISEQTPLYYDIDYMRPSLANQSIETNFQDSSDEEFWNPQEEYLSDLVSSQYELDDVLFDESFLTELEECGLQK